MVPPYNPNMLPPGSQGMPGQPPGVQQIPQMGPPPEAQAAMALRGAPGPQGPVAMDAQMREYLAGLAPDARKRLLSDIFRDYEGEAVQVADEMQRGDELRETPMPGMRTAGRLTQAANPLEFLGAVGQRGVGEYLRSQGNKARFDMSAGNERARSAIGMKNLNNTADMARALRAKSSYT